MTELWQFNVLAKSGIWPILYQLMAILAKCFEIWTSNLFYLYINFDIQILTKSLHVRDVNILVIRDFLCILHNIL